MQCEVIQKLLSIEFSLKGPLLGCAPGIGRDKRAQGPHIHLRPQWFSPDKVAKHMSKKFLKITKPARKQATISESQ